MSCDGPETAGVSHGEPQKCTFEGPGLQKHHQNSTRRHPEREEKNEFCGGRGQKRAKLWAVQGKGGPGKGGPNQTPHETPLRETAKQAPTPHSTQHTAHTTHTTHNTHKSNSIWPKSVSPKSVLAKVGHTTKTPTLAKVGLAKVGHDRPPIIPVGPQCPDSSNARRRASVVRLDARQTLRSQGCPRIRDTGRDCQFLISRATWLVSLLEPTMPVLAVHVQDLEDSGDPSMRQLLTVCGAPSQENQNTTS